ncbi:MAG TPA: cupin domain-containing protein [Candidatus Limnocylindrales bacterium]|nr:cupin domain-containing protein [Candidatus Limnocylindrales bacterium]
MFSRRRLTGAIGLGLTLALLGAVAVLPSLASNHIVLEPLSPRSLLTDDVSGQVRIKVDGDATTVINMKDLSRTVVTRITVQPGAMFPWHTHSGPVLVNVAQGELVYISAEDCVERAYQAGEAFIDPGHGHVHSARNRTSGVTVLYATFLQVPETGPLTLTEGVTAPDCTVAP